jgi:hypothetical protein
MRAYLYVNVSIHPEPETGQWVASIANLPDPKLDGIVVHGPTREAAYANSAAYVLRVIADQLAHGNRPAKYLVIKFYDDEAICALQFGSNSSES